MPSNFASACSISNEIARYKAFLQEYKSMPLSNLADASLL